MPRVLIVTSMFLPHLAADMHRARILARELGNLGWKVELLAPGPSFQLPAHLEPHAKLLEIDVPIHFASPRFAWFFHLVRSRSLGWRAYLSMKYLGDALIQKADFDLIYISCSQANFFYLGVGWKKRFGVPFIIDLHDPWYQVRQIENRHISGWKYSIASAVSRILERRTLGQTCGLVSVSQNYLDAINTRYADRPWCSLRSANQVVMPFSHCERDLDVAKSLSVKSKRTGKGQKKRIVYTGAGGVIMEKSFYYFCVLLNKVLEQRPSLREAVSVDLFGTEPLALNRLPVLATIANELEIKLEINEHPARLSYLSALVNVVDADGLLVLGVDDPAYMPSKLFLYGATGKPMLACMRMNSVVNQYFSQTAGLGGIINFGGEEKADRVGDLFAVEKFLDDVLSGVEIQRMEQLNPWAAASMARKHVDLFERCMVVGGCSKI